MPDDNVDSAPDPLAAATSNTTNNIGGGNFRGPLRYEIETSSSILEAGKMFSVFLRITNPYDVPVTISSVQTQLPVEFLEPYGNRPVRGSWQKIKHKFSEEYKTALVEGTQKVSAKSFSNAQAGRDDSQAESEQDADTQLEMAAVDENQANVLQPGNAILKEFTIRTRERNSFTPSIYWFHMQICYEMEGKTNYDTAKTSLNIKAPISAMVYGAVLGAVIGTLLRYFDDSKQQLSQTSLLVSMFASILIGIVLVVAFARKKDAQPFISVEDFYGGAFIGVLAGYGGYSLFHQAMNGGMPTTGVQGAGGGGAGVLP
ncbi:MAG: hypothetical protein ACJ8HJ_26395 [Massilia sp.]